MNNFTRDETIEILKTFASIKEGEKYYVSSRTSGKIDMFSFFYRKYYNENREVTIEFIKNVLFNFYPKTPEEIQISNNVVKGLKNLSASYDDSMISLNIKILIDSLYFKIIRASGEHIEETIEKVNTFFNEKKVESEAASEAASEDEEILSEAASEAESEDEEILSEGESEDEEILSEGEVADKVEVADEAESKEILSKVESEVDGKEILSKVEVESKEILSKVEVADKVEVTDKVETLDKFFSKKIILVHCSEFQRKDMKLLGFNNFPTIY